MRGHISLRYKSLPSTHEPSPHLTCILLPQSHSMLLRNWRAIKIRSLHVIQFMALEITLLLWCGLVHPFYLSFDFSLTSQCVSGANESTEESSRQCTNIYMSDSKDITWTAALSSLLHSSFSSVPPCFLPPSDPYKSRKTRNLIIITCWASASIKTPLQNPWGRPLTCGPHGFYLGALSSVNGIARPLEALVAEAGYN